MSVAPVGLQFVAKFGNRKRIADSIVAGAGNGVAAAFSQSSDMASLSRTDL